jgi:membrane protein DedA with SNARE-associated domain
MPDFTGLLIEHASYLSIFFVLVLTGSGLPIPEEVPIILAGVLSAPPGAELNPGLAFMWCLLGAIIGDCVMYAIGYNFGRAVLREHPWFARFVTPEREIQIEQQFRNHGLKVFFIARFLVGLRTPVYLTAGILRVSFRRFFLIDLFCATMVVGTFFSLAYIFGKQIAEWAKRGEVVFTIAVILGLAVVSIYLWRRYKRKLAASDPHPCNDVPDNSPGPESPATNNKNAKSADTSPPNHKTVDSG